MLNLPLQQYSEDVMKVLAYSANNTLSVAIRYKDKDGDITERIVDPYEIKNGKLFAHCNFRDGIRAFSLQSINSAVPTDKEYKPKFPVKFDTFAIENMETRSTS